MSNEMSQTFSTMNHSQMKSLNLSLGIRNYLRKSSFCWLNLHLQTSKIILSSESSKWHSADFHCLWQIPLTEGMKRNCNSATPLPPDIDSPEVCFVLNVLNQNNDVTVCPLGT